MKNKKAIFLGALITIFLTALLTLGFLNNEEYDYPSSVYQVYLDGEKLGMLSSEDELYNLINEEQVEIKKEYNVDQVYPPKGFQIVEKNTYNDDVSSVEDVYETIKEKKQFTIKGYTITIKSNVDGVEPTYIYVLDDNTFKEALTKVVTTFIGTTRYDEYLNNTQEEIVDTGYTIENMYFQDTITVKESYISVDEKIYTDVQELTKYLLFGNDESEKTYTVVAGDTIEKIAETHQLNTSELLIANDSIQSEDTLLAIGETLNVALINPVLTFIHEELVVEDVSVPYDTVYEEDSNQYTDYRETKQTGENGITRTTSRVQFVNGAQSEGGIIVNDVSIKEKQNEIIVKGTKKRYSGITGSNIDVGGTWGWPTNTPYIITSEYGYRWGTLHDGMDISGTGYGSPIYASQEGTVIWSGYRGYAGSAAGLNIVVQHANGWCTVYAHLSATYVSLGDYVTRRQVIGAMGNSGNVTGTHLHFGVFTGIPYNGGVSINPRRLWQ